MQNRFCAAPVQLCRRHLAAADRWFERYGSATVLFTRMLPIVRTFISLPAGVARISTGSAKSAEANPSLLFSGARR